MADMCNLKKYSLFAKREMMLYSIKSALGTFFIN